MIFTPQQFYTYSLRESPFGGHICAVLSAALNAADAGNAVKNHLKLGGNTLLVNESVYNLSEFNRKLLFGVGKASVPMLSAAGDILTDHKPSGMVITKDGYLDSSISLNKRRITIFEAGHPIPDQRNIDAGVRVSNFASDLQPDDLVIVLLSGGGSSLLTCPAPGIELHDVQHVTSLLLKCGANIAEINTLRKHMDLFKGGGLANMLSPATVITLILSDVIGDPLDAIASGPTVPDPTTYHDAWAVLKKYQILDQVPVSIIDHLTKGMGGSIPETVKPGDPILGRGRNIIIGNNSLTVRAAVDRAKELGFDGRILTTSLQGEASTTGCNLSQQVINLLHEPSSIKLPALFLAGGETTVTVHGSGTGGRNQELALGSVEKLSGQPKIILISLATDGGDGPTDAAGAVVTNETYSRGLKVGLHPRDFLAGNDAYHYFESLGDLIKTGPTLTNVNDIVFVFAY